MKTIYHSITLTFLLFVVSTMIQAQNPCSGSPGSNTIMPLNYTICQGTSPSMSLANTYTVTGITYQWYYSPISNVGPWTTIPGATLSTYSGSTLTANMFYQVIITCTNSGQSIVLNTMVSTILCTTPCTGTPASSTIIPVTQNICAGNMVTMSLSPNYSNTGLSYQWGSSSSSSGPFLPISGAALSTHSTSALFSTTYYNVIVTCTNSGLTFSTTHTVTVISCTSCSGLPGTNTVLPLTQTVCTGSSASMSLANTYTASGITYQWQSSTVSPVGPFTNIVGANSNTYTSPPLNGTCYYNVIITCTNSGQSISVPHMVLVLNCSSSCTGAPGANLIMPPTQTICAGDIAAMSLASTYSVSGISYQWSSASSLSGPFAAIVGASLSTYSSTPLTSNMYYVCIITCTNSGVSFTTVPTLVSVVTCTYCSGAPFGYSVVPITHTVCSGNTTSMSLASGFTVSGLNYQWQSSTTSSVGPFTPIPGATSSTLATPSLSTNGFYSVIISCTNSGMSTQLLHVVTVVNCINTSGITNLASAGKTVLVYPNPTTGEFVIERAGYSPAKISIADVSGRIITEIKSELRLTNINLPDLANGLYFIKVADAGGTVLIKVLKN